MSELQTTSDFRTYLAESVEAAMARARAELGEDAVLLGSRRVARPPGGPAQYEVSFGLPVSEREEPERSDFARRLAAEVAEMRRQIAVMHQALTRSVVSPPRWQAPNSPLRDLLFALVHAEVDGDLAQEIVEAVHSDSASDPGDWLDIARLELARRLKLAPCIGTAEMGRRVVALVGPPGAGKTTTLVKLGVQFGLAARRSVHLISTDDYRIGGADQLRSFAAILGVGFQAAGTVAALAQALTENRSKDLVLIDTPGVSAGEVPECADLARFLSRREDIDTQLVLMSSTRSADLHRVTEAYRMYRPAKLIFSRTDETGVLGGAYSVAVRSGIPVSFLTTGQRIPEDLQPATHEAFADRLLTCNQLQSEAAA